MVALRCDIAFESRGHQKGWYYFELVKMSMSYTGVNWFYIRNKFFKGYLQTEL